MSEAAYAEHGRREALERASSDHHRKYRPELSVAVAEHEHALGQYAESVLVTNEACAAIITDYSKT